MTSPPASPRHEWQQPLTAALGAEVRRLRTSRGLTADALISALGGDQPPMTRPALANLETGRRDGVTVGEWWALAVALEAPPISLLLPDLAADVQVAPGRYVEARLIPRWITGDLLPDELIVSEESEQRYDRAGAVLTMTHQHDDLLGAVALAEDNVDRRHYQQAVALLAQHRQAMAALGMPVPDLDDDTAAAVAALGTARRRPHRKPSTTDQNG